MIRYIQCLRRKQGLPVDEFRRHWRRYQTQVQSLAKLANAKRASVSFSLEIAENAELQKLRGTAKKYDSILEVWWESGSEVETIAHQPELEKAMNGIQQMQEEFMSLPESGFFFASDEEALDLSQQ